MLEFITFSLFLLPYLIEAFFITKAFKYRIPEKGEYDPQARVAVHVPAYREPPDLLISTVSKLLYQSHNNYRVYLLINNTPEGPYTEPVRRFCGKVSEKCTFLHFETKGFKGGALDVGMQMDHGEEYVAVVDSDYHAHKDFLKEGLSYFRGKVAIVQFPQDYRDFPESKFYRAMYLSYRYFFAVIMRMCQVLGAVAFMGTMGIIAREAIRRAGGWSKSILTEDSELGLRILKAGYLGVYVDRSMGKGLMPHNFSSVKRQRFRWSYGNAQTILRHLFSLTFGSSLSKGQKIALWVQNTVWFTPMVPVLLFNTLAFMYPLLSYIAGGLLAGFLLSRAFSFLYVYRKIDGLTFREALSALIFYLSLFGPMSLAPVRALIPFRLGFYRTPKKPTKEKELYAGEVFLSLWTGAGIVASAYIGNLNAFLVFLFCLLMPASTLLVLAWERKASRVEKDTPAKIFS